MSKTLLNPFTIILLFSLVSCGSENNSSDESTEKEKVELPSDEEAKLRLESAEKNIEKEFFIMAKFDLVSALKRGKNFK